MINPKRITIFTGHFGSGKTEVAINYAVNLRKMGKKVIIIDYDFVNPYFRTKDAEAELTRMGIEVIASPYANSNIENPALPPEINKVFENKDAYVIFDVGGDDDGAVCLGRFKREFEKEDYNMLFVLNQRRIITETAGGAVNILRDIETVSRLKVTGIINNTHLKQYTEPKTVSDGEKLAEEVSRLTKIPIEFTSAKRDIIDKIDDKLVGRKFPLDLYINLKF